MITLDFRSLEKGNPSFYNFTTLGEGGYKGISKTGSNEQYFYAPRLILFRLYQQKVKSRIKESLKLWHWFRHTTQKMEFSIKDCFSKCDQIHSFLLPHLPNEKLHFGAVTLLSIYKNPVSPSPQYEYDFIPRRDSFTYRFFLSLFIRSTWMQQIEWTNRNVWNLSNFNEIDGWLGLLLVKCVKFLT